MARWQLVAGRLGYTVRSGRRPSRLTPTGSTNPRSASLLTVSYTGDSRIWNARSWCR